MSLTATLVTIIEAIQAGRDVERHFAWLYQQYYPQVLRFYLRRKLAREIAEELTQNTFLSVYSNLKGLRQAAQFENWLWQIARRELHHKWEKEQALKRKGLTVSLEADGNADFTAPASLMAELPDMSPTPQKLLLDQENVHLVREALRQLPEQMRRCLELRILLDLKYHEIAQTMNLSINTVKSHLFQAREQLRQRLGSHFDKFDKDEF